MRIPVAPAIAAFDTHMIEVVSFNEGNARLAFKRRNGEAMFTIILDLDELCLRDKLLLSQLMQMQEEPACQ